MLKFTALPYSLIGDHRLSCCERQTLYLLELAAGSDRFETFGAGKDRLAIHTAGTLSKLTGYTRRAINKSISHLADYGYIESREGRIIKLPDHDLDERWAPGHAGVLLHPEWQDWQKHLLIQLLSRWVAKGQYRMKLSRTDGLVATVKGCPARSIAERHRLVKEFLGQLRDEQYLATVRPATQRDAEIVALNLAKLEALKPALEKAGPLLVGGSAEDVSPNGNAAQPRAVFDEFGDSTNGNAAQPRTGTPHNRERERRTITARPVRILLEPRRAPQTRAGQSVEAEAGQTSLAAETARLETGQPQAAGGADLGEQVRLDRTPLALTSLSSRVGGPNLPDSQTGQASPALPDRPEEALPWLGTGSAPEERPGSPAEATGPSEGKERPREEESRQAAAGQAAPTLQEGPEEAVPLAPDGLRPQERPGRPARQAASRKPSGSPSQAKAVKAGPSLQACLNLVQALNQGVHDGPNFVKFQPSHLPDEDYAQRLLSLQPGSIPSECTAADYVTACFHGSEFSGVKALSWGLILSQKFLPRLSQKLRQIVAERNRQAQAKAAAASQALSGLDSAEVQTRLDSIASLLSKAEHRRESLASLRDLCSTPGALCAAPESAAAALASLNDCAMYGGLVDEATLLVELIPLLERLESDESMPLEIFIKLGSAIHNLKQVLTRKAEPDLDDETAEEVSALPQLDVTLGSGIMSRPTTNDWL